MIVYHITDKEYELGQIVDVNDFDGYSNYHLGLTASQRAINEYLSDNRPTGEPSRQLCLYAFEKPEYCIYFRKNDISRGQTMHLYKCEMNSLQGHPMILVNQFSNTLESNWGKLKNEYWHPTKVWKLKEQMAEEMRILEEIPITSTLRSSSFMIGNNDYADDSVMARRL